ncbi:MAG: hypothetical protein AAB367_04670 [Patescibacteria group bacterium]
MEKAPGQTPEDFRDQLQSFFERNGEKELADVVAAESKDQEAKARARIEKIDAEINAEKKEIDRINEAVRRGEVIYGENPGDRVQKAEARIRELEDMKAGREKKPDIIEQPKQPEVIELTEDDIEVPEKKALPKRKRDRYDKTLEDEPEVIAEKPAVEKEEKEQSNDSLEGARPDVRERLMAAGMNGVGTLAERSVLMLGGKGMDLYERIAGYPTLKRERAQKAADEYERAIEDNRKNQEIHAGDAKMLQKLRGEKEGLERNFVEARTELRKKEVAEATFNTRKRSFEGGMRKFASDVLEKLNKRFAPFERELEAARATVERSRKTIASINRDIEKFKEVLDEKREQLNSIQDPFERKKLEAEIQGIEGSIKGSLPLIDRVVKKQELARKALEKNEEVALPYRQQQRRFARAAGLEAREDILSKGTPPEDLPVMSKVVRLDERREGMIGAEGVTTFIDKWNGDILNGGRRISNPDRFKELLGGDKAISSQQIKDALKRYFQEEARAQKQRFTPREGQIIDVIAKRIGLDVFKGKNVLKKGEMRQLRKKGAQAEVARRAERKRA